MRIRHRGCCACNCSLSMRHVTESNGYFCPSYTPHPLTTTAANVFWPLAAIEYASVSGDYQWLESVLPQLREAVWMHTKFNLVDPTQPSDFPRMGLIRAPGPLWVSRLQASSAAFICPRSVSIHTYILRTLTDFFLPLSTLGPPTHKVDPFLRSNYTAETNMFTLDLFRRYAEVEEHFLNSTAAAAARATADRIAAQCNALLWVSRR
jgi:hypothetical protein